MHTPIISYIRKEYINNKCTHQWYLILEKNTSTTNAHTNDILYQKRIHEQQMHTPMISYIRKEYINNKCTHQWYLILEKNTSTTNAHTNDILY